MTLFFPNIFPQIPLLLSPKYILQIVLIVVHKLPGYVHWDNGVNKSSPPYIVSMCTLICRNQSLFL